jgi:sodium transport system ATP-binding protein
MIEIENLSKQFRTKLFKKPFVAVDSVSFKVNDGEVVGLLGPNGAGKTTIMRLLATVLSPVNGTARIGGYDVRTHPADVRRVLGILPEYSGLYERFTPREHLRMFGKFYDIKDGPLEKRIDELIVMFDMKEYADRECKRFSKGMSQKIALARTLVHDPQHLLLDEPTSGLDVMSARQVRQLISKSQADGKCVIVSTHILSEAERLCDRLVVIDAGRVVADGTAVELCERVQKKNLEDAFLALLGREDVEVVV